MLYFSELKGKKVITQKGARLGRLVDLVFLASDQPLVTKLVVKGGENHRYTIPLAHLVKLNSVIVVTDTFAVETLVENELYIDKNILDQQILDLKGNKIVRVNDVAIQDKPVLMIAGVDIGLIGILRWFGVDETFGRMLRLLGKTIQSRFLSWADIQPLELARGKVVLKKEQKKLNKLLPEDLADHLENTNIRSSTRMLDLMDAQLAAEVVENLNITYQQAIFKQFAADRSAKLINYMDPDEAVDVLLTLSEKRRANIISKLSPEKQAELANLFSVSQTSIGGLMTTEFFTASPEETALKLRDRIRKETGGFSALFYIYAVNKQNQIVGVANLQELLLQSADTPLYKFMNPSLIVLHLTTPLEIAIKRMLKYKVEALPVIDANKKILGIVTIDDIAEPILEKL